MNTNIVVLEGNLTRDPQIKTVGSKDTAVANFSIAVNRRKPDGNGGWTDLPPSFYEVQAWKFMAERVMQLSKGEPVIVVGDLEIQSYKDKEGNDRQSVRVTATSVGRQLRKADSNGGSNKTQNEDDEIPF